MLIDVKSITERGELRIEKGLCDYRYIMKNQRKNDEDFQDVFYDFYLKARWAVMSKQNNRDAYFEQLQKTNPKAGLIDVLTALKDNMPNDSYEFSLASKLLHTKNANSPIYDRKVREYLSTEENVDFWWHRPQKESGCKRSTKEIKKITHDWDLLKKWYDDLLSSSRGKNGWSGLINAFRRIPTFRM